MGSNMMNNLERICELNVALYSPTEYEEVIKNINLRHCS
jgi:hypothetical protein